MIEPTTAGRAKGKEAALVGPFVEPWAATRTPPRDEVAHAAPVCPPSPRSAASSPTRRATRRCRHAPPPPTTSGRARARRSGAPCRRAGSCPLTRRERTDEPGGNQIAGSESRLLRRRGDAQRLLERVRGRPAPERDAVDLDERHDLADGRRRERFVCSEHVGQEVRAFLDLVAASRGGSSRVARVTPARIPRSSAGVNSVPPFLHQMFVTVPSST